MLPPPLLGRAIVLHQQNCRADVAQARQTARAIVGTRTRGGIFTLTIRHPRPERTEPRLAPLRPALA